MIKEKLKEFEKEILMEQVRLSYPYHRAIREAPSAKVSSLKPANDKALEKVGKEDEHLSIHEQHT